VSVPVPIPYSVTYTATAAGRVCKIVPCEKCAAEYFYQMERSAEGAGTSFLFFGHEGARERAASAAEENLRQTLMQEFDIVPCPHCGHYQSYMVPTVRWAHLAWLRTCAILLLVVAVIIFVVYVMMFLSSSYTADVLLRMRICLILALALGIPAMVALVTKFVLTRRYDPNNPAEADDRIRLAKARCITWEEFERIMEAAIDKAIENMKSSEASNELPAFLKRKKG
jgi:hypothetical protein